MEALEHWHLAATGRGRGVGVGGRGKTDSESTMALVVALISCVTGVYATTIDFI